MLAQAPEILIDVPGDWMDGIKDFQVSLEGVEFTECPSVGWAGSAHFTDEQKATKNAAIRASWDRPGTRAEAARKSAEYQASLTPEQKAEQSAKKSRTSKVTFATPEVSADRSARMASRWQDPQFREQNGAKRKAAWAVWRASRSQ